MIDFDVVTGPGPSEAAREPEPKPAPRPPAAEVVAGLPRATLLPRLETPRPPGEAKSRP
jgi:hypothetical protein